jgi:NADPH-dependent curcumin reductase CurA
MSTAVNRQFLLKTRPVGRIDRSNFDFIESPIPEVGEGDVLLRNL